MAPDHSSAAPSSDGAGSLSAPPPDARPGRAQHRLLATLAGLGAAALAGGTYVLTYEDLRALALAGGAATRWAPVYPVLVDVLITVTVLALVATRHARWWSRWPRWVLLLVLVAGAAAAGVQRAVKGYEALPDDALRAGVAVAPSVMLVIVVWLWLAMFRQFQRSSRRAAPKAAPEPAPVVVNAPEPEAPAVAGPRLAISAPRSEDTWLFDDTDDDDRETGHETQEARRATGVPPLADEPGRPYQADAHAPSPRLAPVFGSPEPLPGDAPPFDPLPGGAPASGSPEPRENALEWDSPRPAVPNPRQHSNEPLPDDTLGWDSPRPAVPGPRPHADEPPSEDALIWESPEPGMPDSRQRSEEPPDDTLGWDSPQPAVPEPRQHSEEPPPDDTLDWSSSRPAVPEPRQHADEPPPDGTLGWDSPEPAVPGPRPYSDGPVPDDAPAQEHLPPHDGESLPGAARDVDVDDDPTPPIAFPTLLPTDVELVRGGARPAATPAATTRPDIVMPSGEEPAGGAPEPDPAEDRDIPMVDRAEDPDGGDDAPVPSSDDLVAAGEGGPAEQSPPSGSLRSSPTPPKD